MSETCVFAGDDVAPQFKGTDQSCLATSGKPAQDCCYACALELIRTGKKTDVTETLRTLTAKTRLQRGRVHGIAGALER